MFKECWYWCWITEDAERTEPDWSRVPENIRESLRNRWATSGKKIRHRWKLWGPQIPKCYSGAEVEGPVQ